MRIIRLVENLTSETREFVLSRQILKSGTSIGANVEEANQGESKKDFIHKLGIAQKEAFETRYWLRLLTAADYIVQESSASLISECEELIKLITYSIKTAKNNHYSINHHCITIIALTINHSSP
ncbi:MAG: four helix bundle protein [Mariniphaga sp.]